MGGLAACLAVRGASSPRLASRSGARRRGHAFPPDVAVIGQCDVGEYDAALRDAMQLWLLLSFVPGATPK